MELKDLKSAWDKFSSNDANKHQLGEDAILDMLKKRTKNMIERIDRNIKIGFGILLLISLLFILDNLLLTPFIADKDKGIEVPTWVFITDAINTIFILGTFIYFNLRYRAVRRSYSHTSDLKNVLVGIVRILNSYRKLFYLALTILLLVLGVSFVTGMFTGFEVAAHSQGGDVQDLDVMQVAKTVAIGILILFAFTIGLFLFFRWGFQKLYGNYIQKLKDTLQELDEIE